MTGNNTVAGGKYGVQYKQSERQRGYKRLRRAAARIYFRRRDKRRARLGDGDSRPFRLPCVRLRQMRGAYNSMGQNTVLRGGRSACQRQPRALRKIRLQKQKEKINLL